MAAANPTVPAGGAPPAVTPVTPTVGTGSIFGSNLGTSNGPWSVGFQGPFRVTTRLEQPDKEIDIDDREAILTIEVEMKKFAPVAFHAIDVIINLVFDFGANNGAPRENITVDGKETGRLRLTPAKGVVIDPDDPAKAMFTKDITIKTGFFSSDPKTNPNADSAIPGMKTMLVEIDYKLRPTNPITPQTQTPQAHMVFTVARD